MNAPNAHPSMNPVTHTQQRAPDFERLAAAPFQSFLELGTLRSAPGSARGHAVNVLRDWGLGNLEYSVAMVISELTTNAVLATEEVAWSAEIPPVRMWLRGDESGVFVLVGDAVLTSPEPRAVDILDESGRGLAFIVPTYSQDWGWYEVPGGKVTWALVAVSNPHEEDDH